MKSKLVQKDTDVETLQHNVHNLTGHLKLQLMHLLNQQESPIVHCSQSPLASGWSNMSALEHLRVEMGDSLLASMQSHTLQLENEGTCTINI